MKVEIRRRWIFLYVSLGIAFCLRNEPFILVGYVTTVVISGAIALILGPRKLRHTEHSFRSESLALLSQRNFSGLEKLAEGQTLIRWFGPSHLLPETLGMAAAGQGDHLRAVERFKEALRTAAPGHINRIQTNLARELSCNGQFSEAQSEYRQILERDHGYPQALAGLGMATLQQGNDDETAITHLELALDNGIVRDAEVHIALAEARLRMGDSKWNQALANARSAGAKEEELNRVLALAGRKDEPT